jgi:hypothetical protein
MFSPSRLRNTLAAAFLTVLVGCGGGGGSSSDPPPQQPLIQATFAVDRTTINAGESVTLTWTSTNATSCEASGGWSGALALSGSQIVGPVQQTTTYTLRCANGSGSSVSYSVAVKATVVPTSFAFEQSWNSVNDAVWDARQQVLYLAVGSDAALYPNSIIAFDPMAGSIRMAVYAGSEPNALAMSDDGNYLYVGFTGADLVRRFSLPLLVLDHTLVVDPTTRAIHGMPTFATDLELAPGTTDTLAITSSNHRCLPACTRFDIFDGDVQRPTDNFQNDYQALSVAWHGSGTRIFGAEFDSSIAAFTTSPALTTLSQTLIPPSHVQVDNSVTYANGNIYNGSGAVWDADTYQLKGSLPTAGLVTVDSANHKVFVASFDPLATQPVLTLTRYDEGSFTPSESIQVIKHDPVHLVDITPGKARRLVRWGTDGLAIVGSLGRLAILWGSFVAPGGTSTPVGTLPSADPCCSQNPLLYSIPQIHTSTIAFDIVFDAHHNMLFAAIPDFDAAHPNTIAVMDPATGVVSNFIPTVPSVGALAVSDDGQYLYAAGTSSYQRFLLPTLAPDATVAYGVTLGLPPPEIAIRPNAPKTLFIEAATSGAFLLFENDVSVPPSSVSSQSWLQWSADGSKYYGLDSASTGMEVWEKSYDTGVFRNLGDAFTHPFDVNDGYPWGSTFTAGGNLLYGSTGAVFDPATGGWPGTLPLGRTVGTDSAYATYWIDVPGNRVFAAVCPLYPISGPCGTYFMEFDATTYVPLGVGVPLGGDMQGWPYRLQRLSPTSFAVLSANLEVVILTSPEFTR